MKSKGQIVHDWRKAKGWNTTRLAREVGTSRQNIENLEADEVDQPRYLPRLAAVMGYASSDELLALMPPPTNPAPRKKASFGAALQALVDSGKPPALVKLLQSYLRGHHLQRRITIGDALKRLAIDPDNDELAREVADLLESPIQETGTG